MRHTCPQHSSITWSILPLVPLSARNYRTLFVWMPTILFTPHCPLHPAPCSTYWGPWTAAICLTCAFIKKLGQLARLWLHPGDKRSSWSSRATTTITAVVSEWRHQNNSENTRSVHGDGQQHRLWNLYGRRWLSAFYVISLADASSQPTSYHGGRAKPALSGSWVLKGPAATPPISLPVFSLNDISLVPQHHLHHPIPVAGILHTL